MIANWSLDGLVSLTDTRVEPEMEKDVPGPATPEVQQLMKLRKKKSTSCEATTIQVRLFFGKQRQAPATESDKTTSSSEKGGVKYTNNWGASPERSSSPNRDISSAAGEHTISATRSETDPSMPASSEPSHTRGTN